MLVLGLVGRWERFLRQPDSIFASTQSMAVTRMLKFDLGCHYRLGYIARLDMPSMVGHGLHFLFNSPV